MIIFWYFLFIVLALIIYIIYDTKIIETYTNQPKLIILMGDSILDNEKYFEKSVVDYIEYDISDSEDTLICISKK